MKYKRVWRKFEQNRTLGHSLDQAIRLLHDGSEADDPCDASVEAIHVALSLRNCLRAAGEGSPEELTSSLSGLLEGLKQALSNPQAVREACAEAKADLQHLKCLLKR